MKLFLAISFFVFSSFVGVLAQKNRNDDLKNEALDDIKALSSKDFPYIELFHQGVREKMAGNFEEAKTIFRKCLDQKKNDDAVYFALAEIAKEENKIGEALNFYQNAYGIDTSNVIYLQELAFMQAEKANFEEAEVLFRKLCKKEPRNLDFIYGYSKVLIYNKQYEQAIKQLTKLQDQAGTVPELMMMKADLYMELKNHQKAEEALLQLKDEFPSNQEVLDKIVAFYKQQGEEEKAKKILNELNHSDPNNSSSQFLLANQMFEEERYADYTTLAMKLLDSETLPLQEKLVVFERLSEIYTGKNESLLKASQLIYDKHSKDFEVAKNHVLILIENQQTKKALEIARKAANANKENYHAWRLALNIASTYWDYAVLFEDAKKALEFFPTMPRLYFDAAKGAIYAKKLNEAIELLAAGELYILDDRQAGALYDMRKGEIYFAKKEYKKGIIAFESALNKAKNKSAVYSTYALELSKANIATEVAENLLSELKNPDQDRNYFLAHGYLSLHSKNYDFGISLLNEGVKATFNNAEIFDLLGDLYFRKGAIDKAIEAWEEAMVLESRNKNLSQKIKEKKYYAPKYY